MTMLQRICSRVLGVLGGASAAHAQEVTVKVGIVRSISTTPILMATEKGYFKEYGIKVVTENLDTAANAIALLAQNQLQLVAGGISAGYFNALEKNLPITMVLDRVSTPIGHNLMLRPDLKDQITQLQGPQGQDHRQQRPGLGLDLRGRQDAGDRGAHHHRRRDQGHSVHRNMRSRSPTRRSTPPSRSRRSPRNCSTAGHRGEVRRPRRAGQAAAR